MSAPTRVRAGSGFDRVGSAPLDVETERDGLVIVNAAHDVGARYRFACVRCGAAHELLQRRCGSCHGYDCLLPAAKIAADAHPDRAHSLAHTEAIQENRIPTGLDWFDAATGGGLPEYACMLLAGGEGGGKTTLALQILATLAGRRPPLLISTEVHSTETAAYAKRLGVRGDAFVYGSEAQVFTARKAIALARTHRAGAVLFDSTSDLEDDDSRHRGVKQFKDWAVASKTPVILISQVNAQGVAEGRRKNRHDVTVYCTMMKPEKGLVERHPEMATLRFFHFGKTRHSGIDGVTIVLRKQDDGRLTLDPTPLPVPTPPAAPPAP